VLFNKVVAGRGNASVCSLERRGRGGGGGGGVVTCRHSDAQVSRG